MGWCGGTCIFDDVAETVLEMQITRKQKYHILITLAESIENMDCDTLNESAYWHHPIVREVFQELHPDWNWSFEESVE